MKHTTETQIKYWQSRLAHAIEDKETAERKLRELGVAPAAMDMNEGNGIIEMEQKLQNHPALSKSAQSSPTEHDKGFILGWRLCYESIFNKEESAMPDPAAPEPEVVPPNYNRVVLITLQDGREFKGYYLHGKKSWHVYYYPPKAIVRSLRPSDTVVSWKEIE